jgi:hypothetical protein
MVQEWESIGCLGAPIFLAGGAIEMMMEEWPCRRVFITNLGKSAWEFIHKDGNARPSAVADVTRDTLQRLGIPTNMEKVILMEYRDFGHHKNGINLRKVVYRDA